MCWVWRNRHCGVMYMRGRTAEISFVWARALREHPGCFDEAMFAAATEHAVSSTARFLSRLLLENPALPFDCAQRLVDRRGVSAVELVRFFQRGDVPTAVAEKHAWTETRVSVLTVLASLPGLSPAVFARFAGFDSSRLRFSLLANPETPLSLRADAAAALHAGTMTVHDQHRFWRLLFDDVQAQPLVFDRLRGLRADNVSRFASWPGLSTFQLHDLLTVAEGAFAAAGTDLDNPADPAVDLTAPPAPLRDFWWLFDAVDHPALDGPALSRVVRMYDASRGWLPPGQWADLLKLAESRVAADIAATDLVSCDVASLRRLIGAGLCHNPAMWRAAVANPCFGLGVAADLAGSVDLAGWHHPDVPAALTAVCSRAAATLPELFAVLSRTRSDVCDRRLFSAATETEAAFVLLSVQNSPRLVQQAVRGLCTHASPDVLSDRVVSLFLWEPRLHGGAMFSGWEPGCTPRARRVVYAYLARRFEQDPQAWAVFFDLVAGTADDTDELLPVGATADLALSLSAG